MMIKLQISAPQQSLTKFVHLSKGAGPLYLGDGGESGLRTRLDRGGRVSWTESEHRPLTTFQPGGLTLRWGLSLDRIFKVQSSNSEFLVFLLIPLASGKVLTC